MFSNYESLRSLFIKEYEDFWLPENEFEAINAWSLIEQEVETVEDVYALVQIRESDDELDLFELGEGPLY